MHKSGSGFNLAGLLVSLRLITGLFRQPDRFKRGDRSLRGVKRRRAILGSTTADGG